VTSMRAQPRASRPPGTPPNPPRPDGATSCGTPSSRAPRRLHAALVMPSAAAAASLEGAPRTSARDPFRRRAPPGPNATCNLRARCVDPH